MRGIGGIFFDDLADGSPEDLFKFVRDCSNAFLPAYYPIVEKRREAPFTEEEKRWQQLRRGHYVEVGLSFASASFRSIEADEHLLPSPSLRPASSTCVLLRSPGPPPEQPSPC